MKGFNFTIQNFGYEKWLYIGERIIATNRINCFYIAPSENSDFKFDVYFNTSLSFRPSPLGWETESKEEIESAFKKLCKEIIKLEPQFKVYNQRCINFANICEIETLKQLDKPRIRLKFGIGGVEFGNTTREEIVRIKNDFKQYCSDNQIKLNETNL